MWPVIIDFGNVTLFGKSIHLVIYSYVFMLVVAFYTCARFEEGRRYCHKFTSY